MPRIAVVGPESSGKTTLAEQLTFHFHGGYSSEVAREYLNELERPYNEADLLEIAKEQCECHGFGAEVFKEFEVEVRTPPLLRDQAHERRSDGYMFCDTDLITIYIWSMEKYGRAHPVIERLARTVNFDHWLLCKPDIPWEPDPLRENPHDRDRLFDVYELTLKEFGKPYFVVAGNKEQRLEMAATKLDLLFDSNELEG
ncbi:MAG: ATP-binding protein [Flavobacteriales bacterium]